jgi:hypothetical protein
MTQSAAGGAGAVGGLQHEARCTAWLAAHMLLERELPDWATGRLVVAVSSQTSRPVDDVGARTNAGGWICVQAKKGLARSDNPGSGLAAALEQLVSIHAQGVPDQAPHQDRMRALDPKIDRVLILTDERAPRTTADAMVQVVDRLRTLPDDVPMNEAANNASERAALRSLRGHLERLWIKRHGADATEGLVRSLLRPLAVQALDLRQNGADLRSLLVDLRAVARDSSEAALLWRELVGIGLGLAKERRWLRRTDLLQELETLGPHPTSVPTRRLGRPIGEWDPIDLEVHRAIELPGQDPSLPALPEYVSRTHDQRLREVVDAAAGGLSQMVVLVGGSSVGKTRACWEAIQRLPDRWSLWHPIDPSRPAAIAEALGDVGPHTVIWLNEAQHYLCSPDPELGERVAAGLRTVLRDPERSPVLVLATMWPEHWAGLMTAAAEDDPDRHAQARQLLAGADIRVPDTFSGTDLEGLNAAAVRDPRLRHAAEHAETGRILQYLAGAPELVARYRNAPSAARAIIEVAIDAQRLGHASPVSRALLERAAPSYMDDFEWGQAGDTWLEKALDYLVLPCRGVPGPLTIIRRRPNEPPLVDSGAHYRLSDYLEQTGRAERAGIFPPAGFWDAAATTMSDPQLLYELARQAQRRGRNHRAMQLFGRAADHGESKALLDMAELWSQAGDQRAADRLCALAAERGNTTAMFDLAALRLDVGDHPGAEALAMQAAEYGDTRALYVVARSRDDDGDRCAAERLYQRAVDCGDTDAMNKLAQLCERAGDIAGAEELYRQAADGGDADALGALVVWREIAEDPLGVEEAYQRAADQGSTAGLWGLALTREIAGNYAEAERLAVQAADLGEMSALEDLGVLRERAGDLATAAKLWQLAVDRGYREMLGQVARLRDRSGDHSAADDIAVQAADTGDTEPLRELLRRRELAGAYALANALAVRAADRGHTTGLLDLGRRRELAGDMMGAEDRYQSAADRGEPAALQHLGRLREKDGDLAGAAELYRQAADQGVAGALSDAALLKERAGERAAAEALAMRAVDRGETTAARHLARLRGEAGDYVAADALAVRGADNGDRFALGLLVGLRSAAGDQRGAERIQRYGLDDRGRPAAPFE